MSGAELKTIREYLGLPASWLATKAEVRERTVNYWESGKTPVPSDVADIVDDLLEKRKRSVKEALLLIDDLIKKRGRVPHAVTLRRFKHELELWQAHPEMNGLPVTYHASILFELKSKLEKRAIATEITY